MIGLPFKMRARWSGEPPKVGEYFASSPDRARMCYRIVAIRGDVPRLVLTVERYRLVDLPAGVIVHLWEWDRRKRRQR